MASIDPELGGDLQLRVNVRPWMVAGVLNLALGAVILGIPYFRGPDRAREALPRFAVFAACLYDAEAAASPGLALPDGDRARYASLVVTGPEDWPARCREPLREIAPEESLFLFPAVKSAEAQLRQTTEALDRELAALERSRAAGDARVGDRPMRAMANVRAALAELGVAASVPALSARREAIRIVDDVSLPAPSTLPLRVADNGPWSVRVEDGALVAVGLDERRAGYIRASEGRVEVRLARRSRRVAELILAGEGEPPWVVLGPPAAECEAGACVERATGLSALLEDRQRIEPMVWLRGHPIGPGAVRVRGRVAWMLAETAEGSELRRFDLPEPSVRALGEEREVPRVQSETAIAGPSGVVSRVVWRGEGEQVAPAVLLESGEVVTIRASAAPRFEREAANEGAAPASLVAAARWLAVGDARGVRLQAPDGRVFGDAVIPIRPPGPRALRLLGPEPVQVFARSDGAIVAGEVVQGALRASEVVERGVAAFDVARVGARTVIAWTDDAAEGAVHVLTLGADGEEVSRSIPAPCWRDPVDGLCGAPRLATDGSTVMLVTRSGSDLRVLRSADAEHWSALEGL